MNEDKPTSDLPTSVRYPFETEDGESLSRPIKNGNTYENPWDTWKFFSKIQVAKWLLFEKDNSNIPKDEEELDANLPVVRPDFEKLKQPTRTAVQYMWIGHASCLIQMEGLTILTDPIISENQYFKGRRQTKRYRKPACTVDELPSVDAVVISHNHYDHLHLNSVKDLNKKFGKKIHWFVPEGLKQWMTDEACENVTELTWWDKGSLKNKEGQQIEFVFTPAQHWCQRGVFDRNKVLWGSWCIVGPNKRFFFAGDTGYCSAFKEIGKKYGPFNCAAIPIGAYHPRYVMEPQHVDPKQAVMIHRDVKSLQSYGIHWGTFKMGKEHYMEPKSLLRESMTEQELDPQSFCTVHHGAVRTVAN